MCFIQRVILLILITLCCNVASSESAEPSSESPAKLSFLDTPLDEVHEGYFALEWTPVEGASYYQVSDSTDHECYEGVGTKSFQSGLSDGTYTYRVQAFDAKDQLLATSHETTVTVRHWGMFQSLSLFSIGLVVVCGIVLVILRGESLARRKNADGEMKQHERQSSSGLGDVQ